MIVFINVHESGVCLPVTWDCPLTGLRGPTNQKTFFLQECARSNFKGSFWYQFSVVIGTIIVIELFASNTCSGDS